MISGKRMVISIKKQFKNISIFGKICVLFAIILIIMLLLKTKVHENFESNKSVKKYTIKRNDNIYDKFYSDIYDELVYNYDKNQYEINALKSNCKLDSASVVLDVGSGTGRHCNLMEKVVKSCTGIDKSQYMINKSKLNTKKSKFVKGDVLVTMNFPKYSFSHITVFYFTLYYIKDKTQFFSNAYHWLKPGGYLIIHLVNKHKFDPIIPAGDPLVLSAQNYVDKRITNTVVEFDKFKYKANFDLKNNKAKLDEKFIYPDGTIRHNQHILWMEDQSTIIGLAKNAGFIVNGKIDLTECFYDKQFIYILQKPN